MNHIYVTCFPRVNVILAYKKEFKSHIGCYPAIFSGSLRRCICDTTIHNNKHGPVM